MPYNPNTSSWRNSGRGSSSYHRLLRKMHDQQMEEDGAFSISDEDQATLDKTFASVKFEFHDLDGLSWSPTDRRRMMYFDCSSVTQRKTCISSDRTTFPSTADGDLGSFNPDDTIRTTRPTSKTKFTFEDSPKALYSLNLTPAYATDDNPIPESDTDSVKQDEPLITSSEDLHLESRDLDEVTAELENLSFLIGRMEEWPRLPNSSPTRLHPKQTFSDQCFKDSEENKGRSLAITKSATPRTRKRMPERLWTPSSNQKTNVNALPGKPPVPTIKLPTLFRMPSLLSVKGKV